MKHSFLFEPFSPFRQRQLYKTAFTAVTSVFVFEVEVEGSTKKTTKSKKN
jgi:hypothetical protein